MRIGGLIWERPQFIKRASRPLRSLQGYNLLLHLNMKVYRITRQQVFPFVKGWQEPSLGSNWSIDVHRLPTPSFLSSCPKGELELLFPNSAHRETDLKGILTCIHVGEHNSDHWLDCSVFNEPSFVWKLEKMCNHMRGAYNRRHKRLKVLLDSVLMTSQGCLLSSPASWAQLTPFHLQSASYIRRPHWNYFSFPQRFLEIATWTWITQ